MSQGAAFGNRWWIVFGATLSMLVAQGPVILYTLGLFIKPLNQEFGWDRASISAAGGVAAIFSALTIPFVGSLMDRWGVRTVLLPIVVLCASSVALIALTPESVVVFMLLFAVTGVLGSGQGPLGYAKCVSAWFDDRRGLALGITMSGIGLGAALVPQYTQFLIGNFGWRAAYAGLGLLTLIGLISRSEDLDLRVQDAIVTSFPLGMQSEVQAALASLQHSAAAYGAVAVAWLLWSGTGYFSHLEWAINRIYIAQNRSFWRQRLMGVGMICALSTSIAAGVIGTWILTSIHGLSILGFFANWIVLAILLWSMYLVVPNREVSLHESWPGALLASLLIQVLNLAFPIYIRLTHNFNAFGRGLLFFLVLVTWLYLVSQLLLVGAVLNRLQLGRIPTIGRSHENSSPWEA